MTWLHDQRPSGAEIAANVLLALAVLAVGTTTYRAATVSASEQVPGALLDEPVPALGERVRHTLADALRIVERDPFHVERRAPEARYLLPESEGGSEMSRLTAGALVGVRLLGTAVDEARGSFVVCQFERESPKVLHIGDTIAGLTLRSIRRATAEFTDEVGTAVTLRLLGTSTE